MYIFGAILILDRILDKNLKKFFFFSPSLRIHWIIRLMINTKNWFLVLYFHSGNNERIGEYSYIGDDGKTYTVRYSAGVNGFRILNGDHIPSGGQTSAVNEPAVEGEEPKEYDYEYYDETKPDSPFVNPHDPTHQSPELLAGNLAGHLAGIFRAQGGATTTTPRPGVPTTTPRLRIFPKGQVELDRTPEGFNFRFQSE